MARQERSKPRAGSAKPISQHQLFPPVVALWFGALFGLGSLAVRPSLLESLIIKTRLDLLVPAAAPPLGVSARALVALTLAAIGSVLGIAIARHMSRPVHEPHQRKRGSLTPVAKASDHQTAPEAAPPAEAGPLGGLLAQRRRALAIEPEEEQFVPHEPAPLPGGAPQIFDISSAGLATDPAEATLDLGAYSALVEPTAAQPAAIIPEPMPITEASPPAMARQIFGQPIADEQVSQDFVREAGFRTSVFDAPPATPLFAPRAASIPDEIATERAAADDDCAVPAIAESVPAASAPNPAWPEPLPTATNPEIADLATRLASAMAKHRAARAGALPPLEAPAAISKVTPIVEPIPRFAPLPATTQPAQQDTPACAHASVPEAMRPLELGGLEDDDGLLDDLLPPRRITMPEAASPPPPPVMAAPSFEPETGSDTPASMAAAPAEEVYASLLNIAPHSLRDATVRVEEPELDDEPIEPVVIFPGQMARPAAVAEPPSPFRRFDSPNEAGHGRPVAASETSRTLDSAEAERSLRMALANLQRMSGAA